MRCQTKQTWPLFNLWPYLWAWEFSAVPLSVAGMTAFNSQQMALCIYVNVRLGGSLSDPIR